MNIEIFVPLCVHMVFTLLLPSFAPDPPLLVLRAHSWPAGQTSPVVVHGPELTSSFLQHLFLGWHNSEGSWTFGTQPSVFQHCGIFHKIPQSVSDSVKPRDKVELEKLVYICCLHSVYSVHHCGFASEHVWFCTYGKQTYSGLECY